MPWVWRRQHVTDVMGLWMPALGVATFAVKSLVVALVSIGFMVVPSNAQSVSNRHHLSCTSQSAPVIVPYADAQTVRLGLPADISGGLETERVFGERVERDRDLRLQRREQRVQSSRGLQQRERTTSQIRLQDRVSEEAGGVVLLRELHVNDC